MSKEVQIVELTAQPAAVIEFKTTHATLPQKLGDAYTALYKYLQQVGAPMAGPPFALYRDVSGPEWTVVAGFPVSQPVAPEGDITMGEMPGGKAAMMQHLGPYEQLSASWGVLEKWIEAQGHSKNALAWELYTNDPDHTPPEQLETLLYWQI